MTKLRQLRISRGLTLEALALEMGVTHGAVTAWECGRATPRADKLLKLAKYFGCSVEALFDDPTDEEGKAG